MERCITLPMVNRGKFNRWGDKGRIRWLPTSIGVGAVLCHTFFPGQFHEPTIRSLMSYDLTLCIFVVTLLEVVGVCLVIHVIYGDEKILQTNALG